MVISYNIHNIDNLHVTSPSATQHITMKIYYMQTLQQL